MQFVYPSSQLLCAPNCWLISKLQRDIFKETLVKVVSSVFMRNNTRSGFFHTWNFANQHEKKKIIWVKLLFLLGRCDPHKQALLYVLLEVYSFA